MIAKIRPVCFRTKYISLYFPSAWQIFPMSGFASPVWRGCARLGWERVRPAAACVRCRTGGGTGGLGEVEPCVTAGERSEPADSTPLTLSRPRGGRTTEEAVPPCHRSPPRCGATSPRPITESPAIRRFAPLTRGYAWCRPSGAQAWRELGLQVPAQMKIYTQCKSNRRTRQAASLPNVNRICAQCISDLHPM